LNKNTSSRVITHPNIIRPISFRSNDIWLSYGTWTCIFCSNFTLSGPFFDVLWYIDLIFSVTHLDIATYQISSQYIKGLQRKVRLTSNLNKKYKFKSHNSGYQDFFLTSFDIFDLIFGMWLYLDELQFKFEFRSGRMIFGWVMSQISFDRNEIRT
jgi:hypothetical protein